MNKNIAQKMAALALPGALFLSFAAPALAVDVITGNNVTVDTSLNTGAGSVSGSTNVNAGTKTTLGMPKPPVKTAEERSAEMKAKAAAKISAAQAKANTRAANEIKVRVDSLNALSSRLNGLKNVSPEVKASLSASVTQNIDALTALQTKIEGDTTVADLKADTQSITKNQRIFALVEPQLKIAAAVDSANTVAKMITEVDAKLKERLTAAQTAGVDVSASLTLETEMMAKVAEAQMKANEAGTLVAGLKPDNGDKTVFESNKTALQSARADIQLANKNLKTAQNNMNKIVRSLMVKAPKAGVDIKKELSTKRTTEASESETVE